MDLCESLNKKLLASWDTIDLILVFAYVLEIFKNQRTIAYVILFSAVWILPLIICTIWYYKDHSSQKLRYGISIGYMAAYVFTLFTSKSNLAFVYILPLLSMIILYHDPNLVAYLGMASIIANIADIFMEMMRGQIVDLVTRDAEIEIVCIVMCFVGCYLASRLYDDMNKQSVASLKQTQEMSLQTIAVIANTVDAKDTYTEGHSRRVAAYSYAIAKKLGMSEKEADDIRTIGLLHDIGKIGIPDSVLHKPGKLTDDEYRIMKIHPTIGAHILKDIKIVDGLEVGAHYHHERYDGKGYPDGLAGENIPYIARIICVADCFDAMHSNRIYRSRFSMEYILEELKKNEGTQFDPKIAEAMISLIQNNELIGIEGCSETTKLDDMTSEKSSDDVLAGKGVYLLDEIENKNIANISDFNRISTEDWAKEFRIHVEDKLLSSDGHMFIIDVDNMHQINETYGYAKGDQVLREMYHTLCARKDLLHCIRTGGDEFLCWVEEYTPEEEYQHRLQILEKDLKDSVLAETGCSINLSMGGSSSVVSGRDYDTLKIDCQKALYYVKRTGKNNIDIYINGKTFETIPARAVEHDLDTIANIIARENDYKGAYHTDYTGFEKIYNLLRNLSNRYLDNVQLILFTVEFDSRVENVALREVAMNILESAIISTLRKTDVTTRYSTTQQLLLLMNINDENMKMITDRIMREFYRMYDKGNVTLLTSTKNVSMAKLKFNPNNKSS